MEKVLFHAIEIDRCANCQGIWFDQWEEKRLKDIKQSEQIDIGDATVGSRLDRATNVSCPVCQIAMTRMEDISQQGLWYESCSQCLGVFLDAGEFIKYKNSSAETLLSLIKRMLGGVNSGRS
jgi:uncharacterized protein